MKLSRLVSRIKTWWRGKPYVVIYDFDPSPEQDRADVREEYYGYFSSPQEARRMYLDLRGPDPKFHNAKICRVVEDLPGWKQLGRDG